MTTAAHGDASWLADEQAALRRVAMLVAGAADPRTAFEAVTAEASQLLGLPILTLMKFEPGRSATVMAATSDRTFRVGTNIPLDGPSALATMLETRRFVRIDSYEGMAGTIAARLRAAGAQAGYAAPIVVDGELWGAMTAVQTVPGVFEDAERRLADFTELIAIAISNADARDDLRRLAAEQAALRRVATLVARGSTGEGFFSVVAEEVRRLFAVPHVATVRFEQRDAVVVGAAGGNPFIALDGHWALDGPSVCAEVLDTGRPARKDEYRGLGGTVAGVARTAGFTSVAGAPIVVDGRVWGAMVAVSSADRLPDRSEVRLAGFTELIATAISNAATRAELIASRARIVTAGDEASPADRAQPARRHPAAADRARARRPDPARPRFEEAVTAVRRVSRDSQDDLGSVLEEIREISRGLHPCPAGPARPAAARSRRSRADRRSPSSCEVSGPRAARAGRGRDVLRRCPRRSPTRSSTRARR